MVCQPALIVSNMYVLGGGNRFIITSSFVETFEMSISSLYPIINNDYVTVKGGYRPLKSLKNISIEQVRHSFPDLDGTIPPKYPQNVINDILESLVSHGTLSIVTLKAFRHYELGPLML